MQRRIRLAPPKAPYRKKKQGAKPVKLKVSNEAKKRGKHGAKRGGRRGGSIRTVGSGQTKKPGSHSEGRHR